MDAYNSLSLFPDVPPLFEHLKSKATDFYPVVFSNGTSEMISTTLSQSPDISPHAHLFQEIVSVESIQRFKPDPKVYEFLCKTVEKATTGSSNSKGQHKDVWLISGNPFDIVGAKVYGMSTCWVDRSGAGWMDAVLAGEGPDVVVRGLNEVVGKVESFVAEAGRK